MGIITDRLIKLFGKDVSKWPAARLPDTKPMPPAGVKGIKLGKKPGRKTK